MIVVGVFFIVFSRDLVIRCGVGEVVVVDFLFEYIKLIFSGEFLGVRDLVIVLVLVFVVLFGDIFVRLEVGKGLEAMGIGVLLIGRITLVIMVVVGRDRGVVGVL